MYWKEFVVTAPADVVPPNGSYVYEVCTSPVAEVSANVFPRASGKNPLVPIESVRVKISSISPVNKLETGVAPVSS